MPNGASTHQEIFQEISAIIKEARECLRSKEYWKCANELERAAKKAKECAEKIDWQADFGNK